MNEKLLHHLLTSSESTVHFTVEKLLHKLYKKSISTKDYMIAFGTGPTLVAHMDTVLRKPPTPYWSADRTHISSDNGLGADDRAGIYAIIELLLRGHRPNLIFTHGEETGGTGALALIDDYPTCPFDTPYLIELDRRGENDCVFYHRTTGGFITYITSFGFKQAEGIFSDIYYFTPAWRLSAVNLSVGYTNEHTRDEKLYPAWLESTIDKVDLILKDKPHTFIQPKLNLKTDFTFN